MIVLSSVTKQFGSKTALNDVSLKIKEGEIIGFLGANGAGKTTTMRLILGYLAPTKGGIAVGRYSPTHDRIAVLQQVGYLPENNPLYPEMKVGEYLNFIASIKQADNVTEMMNEVNLADVGTSRIEELSRGYKQRVGLTAALLGNPSILILDEPTSGLDPIEQDRIRALIKKIAKKKSVIFSTHILSEVEDIATRLVIIDKGSIVYDGDKPKAKGGVEKLFKKLVAHD